MSHAIEPTLRPQGALDADAVARMRGTLETAAGTAAPRVILDLSLVSRIDGSGLGAIAYLFKRLVARGRRLELTGARGETLATLSALGLLGTLGLGGAEHPSAWRWLTGRGGMVPARGGA